MNTVKKCALVIIIYLCISSIQTHFGNIEFISKSDQGEKCEWEGKNGTCVDFWTCSTNAIDAVHGKHPPVCHIEGSKVYACCTGCDLVANISSIVILHKYGIILTKTGKKSRDKCLDYMKLLKYPCYEELTQGDVIKEYEESSKCFGWIISYDFAAGGVDATRSEFPHMALLGYGDYQESAEWLCGGTIISERFILTAGHCRSSTQLGEVQFVALGILKRSDPPSLWQVYRVDTFIPHPEYRPPSKYHDIALIRTDRRISLGGSVLPACLPQGGETMDKGDATGWGALGHRKGRADVLQKVDVTEFSSENCSRMYQPHRHLKQGYNHTTQMCYGDANVGKDTCEGDSGGPLQLDHCPHVVFGVTSSGHPCGFAGGAGLYTRVTYYVPWIESIVWL